MRGRAQLNNLRRGLTAETAPSEIRAGAFGERKAGEIRVHRLAQAQQLLDLLAFCAASALNALPGTGAANEAKIQAEAVSLDMADWWEPTAQGYLNHVSKAQIVMALEEAGPDATDDGVGAMKKDVLVIHAQ